MYFQNVASEDELMESLGKNSEISAEELDNVSGGICVHAGICILLGNGKQQDSDESNK